ncbi:MAG: type VII secretion protein EssC [Bacilli bacterium]
MLVSLIKKSKIYNVTLPSKVAGSFWLCDEYKNNAQRKVISVEEKNGRWFLKSNIDSPIIINSKYYDEIYLEQFKFYTVFLKEEKMYVIIYCQPVYDPTFEHYSIRKNTEFTIGSGNENAIFYKNSFIEHNQAVLTYKDNQWMINNTNDKNIVFINNYAYQNRKLQNGDVIFIMGLKIVIMNNELYINNPKKKVICSERFFSIIVPEFKKLGFTLDDEYINGNRIYHTKSPRIRTKIVEEEVIIDPPPAKKESEDKPFIYTVGPMLTMSMISITMIYTAIAGVQDGTRDLKSSIPNLIMAGAMLLTMLMWPLLLYFFQKRLLKRKEKLRQNRYSSYLTVKKYQLDEILNKQKKAMYDNFLSLKECQDIIINKKSNIWEREKEQNDFLVLRLGIAEMKLLIKINYEKEKFTLEDDNLKTQMLNMVSNYDTIKDAPLTLSFTEKFIVGLTGESAVMSDFLKGLILQIITFHSCEDVKIVLFTNENNEKKWDFLKICPHIWNDEHTLRFFTANNDDIKEVMTYLEKVFEERNQVKNDDGNSRYEDSCFIKYNPYYIIISDDFDLIRSNEFVKYVLNQKVNLGFSVIVESSSISNLPNECMSFISVTSSSAGLFENELITNEGKSFIAEIDSNLAMRLCCSKLANIPIEYKNGLYQLPNVVGFLEMYEAGKVEQLNIVNRWKENNPIISLQAPVGIGEQGDIFKLDLHEKIHGPHGLIAGMTGSGKSEFIITYVLSLAINYHPDEVSFVLIDYKGGGLAGAFENKITGVKLPHLAGTITNLDTLEMKRSLSSIESELRRRQRMFNDAREKLNESTIDIYKYQKFYREGLVNEPISHLFIISDEFAELKSQQPEFMSKLISTARIGRSLGVHLILATQKPAGVVNEQIWSNSRFRVCLKVQEKADSMDMIKVPDAASLKETGRFYLQVGYNELFAKGQSAWCGKAYIPQEKLKIEIDTTMDFVDNIGNIIKSVDVPKVVEKKVEYMGEELTNIVKYLSDTALKENIKINQLWLDRIPDFIYINNLKKKYNYQYEQLIINPIIGEYDDPNNQIQGLLCLPLSQEGNTVIYGTTGSGKELLLNTLIYSILCDHTPNEVNFYILDFGSETFRIFKDAPHIGDVLLSSEKEKIVNFFKMIDDIIIQRKKIFFEYNGSYELYCKTTKKVIPRIIIIINNFDGIKETYNSLIDEIQQLTRDGLKCGIIFVITATSSNSISYRLQQNLAQTLVLQMNDISNYGEILGNCKGIFPFNALGRGIFRKNDVYEFQTAHITTNEKFNEYIKSFCLQLKNYYKVKASNVPVLPEKVTIFDLKDYFNQLPLLPVGIAKDNLQVIKYNFFDKMISIIVTNDINNIKHFIKPLIEEMMILTNIKKIIIDPGKRIDQYKGDKGFYMTDNFQLVIDQLQDKIDKKTLQKKVTFIIIGLNEFLQQLTNMEKFKQLFDQLKQSNLINFIFVDEVNKYKKINYENWYSSNVNNNSGIYIGYGFLNQSIIMYNGYIKNEEDLGDKYGFIVENGKAVLVKLIEEVNNDK